MRRALVLVALVACRGGESREHDGAPPHDAAVDAAAVRTKAIPCVPKDARPTLEVHDEAAATCWGDRCIELALAADTATPSPRAGPPAAWYGPDAGPTAKLGPRLAATRARTLTSDGKLAVVGTEVWSVAADAPVALRPPLNVFGGPAKIVRVRPVGPWLVATWVSEACLDPANWADPACGLYGQLVDRTGRNHGVDLTYYDPGPIGQFDDTLFFVTSQTVPGLALFDIATGNRRWQLGDLGIAFKILDAARVKPGLVAMLLRDGFVGYRLLTVSASDRHPPDLVTIRYLPFCEP